MKLFVVGLGPGGAEQITPRAMAVLNQCDVIAGYTVYIDLIRELFPGKRLLDTPMKQEEKRCRLAIEEALSGNTVALVSSGDAGVYGMAGIMYETAREFPEIEIEVVAGITAACSGGALLGAPLSHDFAVISLSDLLTPWEKIEARLQAAAQADFVICLYNPASKKRSDYLARASEIIMRFQSGDLPAGIVRNIGREDESWQVTTLAALREIPVDMFTTVMIGNSQTRIIRGKMVTPRGYRYEET
ncbi:precorrin-3 methyltransferase [Syntrophobotulus glycolicus DSM 8271]|uniref:Precorrin-3 methyltransferase n=1 Tax=Syntrophobotulus glycolicus (strain DSM 8271 / FlGlyR) TaxID=645991 RepID=F0SZ41_SYNGF|nr:precorrin-3B C(17)-methyltransferase [Syntrophobotulus glycolicus]ADY57159.1 precorrin-3 methyltransferase [Syntrophobotulus glycolicus DSM 8271]